VEEDYARTFVDNWSGSGQISGTGDTEQIILDSGEYMESEIVHIGVNQVQILIDKYRTGSGSSPTIKYKDGDTEENCDLDTWNTYTGPFSSSGYNRIRVEN